MEPTRKSEAMLRSPSAVVRWTAAVLAIGVAGCGGNPYLRLPKPDECPEGSVEMMLKQLQLHVGDAALTNSLGERYEWRRLPEGETQSVLMRPLGALPKGTILGGYVILGTGPTGDPDRRVPKAFIRYTWALAPGSGGKRYPVCLRMLHGNDVGLPLNPEKGFAEPEVHPEGFAQVVTRFNEGHHRAE